MTQKVLGLNLQEVDQTTAIVAMMDAWEAAQRDKADAHEQQTRRYQDASSWSEWWSTRIPLCRSRQTLVAIGRMTGLIAKESLQSAEIRLLDMLLKRRIQGESLAKLKRDAKRNIASYTTLFNDDS